ncbi:MAG: carboxypeptidase regulatory-like domain-containing protein [Candidatus Eremiobacteraeota bacterium]|nr:carboxypeptidase regulatory-like domain-containing protein [Candidatus Eremiobacteraeota bacterium]
MTAARRFNVSGVLLVILISLLPGITGCSGGGGDSGATTWWGGGGETAQTYAVSGTLRDTISAAPVQGAACTLFQTKSGGFLKDFMRAPKETVTVSTTTTAADGTYRFTGIPSGTYTLKFTKADYVTLEVTDLSVTSDTSNVDKTVVQTSQWNQIAGPDAPYDATKDYVIVDASLPSKGTSGIAATITPSTGVKIGYFTDGTPPTIDWNATGTFSNGRIIFYGLTPGTKYTITFALSGYSFPALSVNSPAGGGVVQNYNIYATSPTPTPTSTVTPTPSPTPTPTTSPTSSPTPTTSPGGGGGGGGGGTGNVQGNVKSGGDGLEGVTVTVGGKTGTTNGNGNYSIANVPAGASQDITGTKAGYADYSGKVDVTTGGTATHDFEMTMIPVITSIDPVSGYAGTEVTIKGTTFGAIQDTSTVTFFNGKDAVIKTGGWSDTSIVCYVPDGAATGDVQVTTASGSGTRSFTVDTVPAGITWKFIGNYGFAMYNAFFTDADYGWIVGASKILFTTDAGATWTEKPTPGTSRSVFFLNRSDGFALFDTFGVYSTTDGGNNGVSMGGPNIVTSYAVQFFNATDGFAAGHQALYRASSGGAGGVTWTPKDNGGINIDDIYFQDTSTGWIAGNKDGVAVVYRTTDGADTLTESYKDTSGDHFFSLCFPSGTNCWVGGSNPGGTTPVIAHTTDGGKNWAKQTFPPGTGKGIYRLHFPKGNIQYGWVVGVGGFIGRTTDGGNTWTVVDTPVDGANTWPAVDAGVVFFTSVTTGWFANTNGDIWKCTLTP